MRLPRKFVVITASWLLLYYGVAWAVPSCCYGDTHPGIEVALGELLEYDSRGAFSDTHVSLECVIPAYHTESMAESSSQYRVDRLRPDTTPRVNDNSKLLAERKFRVSDLWLAAVFEGLSFLVGSPRYLSLSILRI